MVKVLPKRITKIKSAKDSALRIVGCDRKDHVLSRVVPTVALTVYGRPNLVIGLVATYFQ